MLKKIHTGFILIIFFGIIVPVYSANHYVDKNANGLNNGSNWTNAWKSFSSINWGVVNPGDNIYISGGTTSKTYYETLTVTKSGTSGNRITILAGIESGHNGTVIIDGQGTRSYGVLINGASYIAVKNITLQKSTQGLIQIKYSNYSFINNCRMFVYGRAGVFVQNSNNTEIRYCHIETGTYVNCQTDGIYSQNTTNNIYDHNYIVVYNAEPTGHDDCIQSFKDNNLTVHSNYFEQNNNKTCNAQGLYATTPTGGVFKFYNNIVNLGYAQSNGMSYRKLTGTGTVQIIGNTLYGKRAYSLLYVTETSDPIIKNNIIYSEGNACTARIMNWSGTKSNIDYNLLYVPHSTKIYYFNGSSQTWSQWRALGFDSHGKNADPKFVNISGEDFSLQSSSPSIDAGLTYSSPYNVDFDNVSRPQGLKFDLGAYEFVSTLNPQGTNTPTTVGETTEIESDAKTPKGFELDQNYPNPFNPSTNIRFNIPSDQNVRINIYNALGQLVNTLVNQFYSAGNYTITFNAANLPSGLYIYTLEAGSFTTSKKMMLVK